MSSAVHKTKLLIVDTSPSMAHVLKTFAETNNYDADVYSDSADACVSLANRFVNAGASEDYDCVILGWPKEQVSLVTDLLGALATVDHSDLPLIVLSEEPDKDVQTLARRRAKTRTLLWRDHKRIEDILDSIVITERPVVAVPAPKVALSPVATQISRQQERPASVLLVDDTPSVCHALRDMFERNGYHVTIAGTAAEARSSVANNRYDLLLTEFFLREESGEDLCRYLQTVDAVRKPVCAVMTRKNLDSVVQRSLSVGAITCLDKSESTEILFARLDAIVRGLSSNKKSAFTDAAAAISRVDALMQRSKSPSILLDSNRTVVAVNSAAARLLSAGKTETLCNVSFEKSIHGAPVKRSADAPVKALFRNLAGESLSVAYRASDIDGARYGLNGEHCMLTFESVDKALVASVEKASAVSAPAPEASAPTLASAEGETNKGARIVAGSPVSAEPAAVNKGAAKPPIPVNVIVDEEVIESSVAKALAAPAGASVHSVLMIDMKMVAAATGDRLSLGKSEPMLDMVKTQLARLYTRKDSLGYLGDGKFVLLLESSNPGQVRALAKKLVARVPKIIAHLSDVELLSHAAFIELPRQSDISARFILKHCFAACLKTEVDGLDNTIYDIDADEKLLPRDATGASIRKPVVASRSVATSAVKVAPDFVMRSNRKVETA